MELFFIESFRYCFLELRIFCTPEKRGMVRLTGCLVDSRRNLCFRGRPAIGLPVIELPADKAKSHADKDPRRHALSGVEQ